MQKHRYRIGIGIGWRQKIGVSVSVENGVLGLTLIIILRCATRESIWKFDSIHALTYLAATFQVNLECLQKFFVARWPLFCQRGNQSLDLVHFYSQTLLSENSSIAANNNTKNGKNHLQNKLLIYWCMHKTADELFTFNQSKYNLSC